MNPVSSSDQPAVKYLVKRPNETEEFSFVTTLEEIKAGLQTGQIKPEWAVKRESAGHWVTVQELIHGQSQSKPTSGGLATRAVKTKLIVAALALFLLTCLFPPWLSTFDARAIHRQKPAGYFFIAAPPAPENSDPLYGVQIDVTRLMIEWAALAAASGMVWILAVKPVWPRDDKINRPQKFIPPHGNLEN